MTTDRSAVTVARVAVCKNENNWHQRFVECLARMSSEHLTFEVINIDADDWIARLSDFDVVIWKPNHMGTDSASHFKEKIYILEKYLHKTVIPNFDTVWHFESKVAQKYLMEVSGISAPRSVATFDYLDALAKLEDFRLPLVFKKSAGAASSNVRLIRTREAAASAIRKIFSRQAAEREKAEKGLLWGRITPINIRAWLDRRFSRPNRPVAYWQEFLPGNPRDLRITVIGNCYAFAFWRKNRPNDFRASGSGSIEYERPVPLSAIRYCLTISDRLNFDSMAYDLLFAGEDFKVVEMSYGYVDSAIFKARGYHEVAGDDLVFHEGNFWPQELWIKWGLRRIGTEVGVAEKALQDDHGTSTGNGGK